jgi:hypothetical protein
MRDLHLCIRVILIFDSVSRIDIDNLYIFPDRVMRRIPPKRSLADTIPVQETNKDQLTSFPGTILAVEALV